MTEWDYDITLKTPLGRRYGTMCVKIAREQMSGSMTLLNHEEPFCGTVDEKGNCSIEGRLVSLLRGIPFRGQGRIDRDSVHLLLRGERNVFFQ